MKKYFWVLLSIATIFGCGPPSEILEKQEQKQAAALEKQMIDPPGMTTSDKAARRRRIELQYGPDAVKKYDEMNRENISESSQP